MSHARASSGQLSVGTAGIGSVHHLSLEPIKRHCKVEMMEVPYQGIAPALAGPLGGALAAGS